jgi:hypothetical protein
VNSKKPITAEKAAQARKAEEMHPNRHLKANALLFIMSFDLGSV